jgi:hypothetical protein
MVAHSTHLKNGIEHVKLTCPHLRKVIDISDVCNLKPQEQSVNSYFESLVRLLPSKSLPLPHQQ